MRPTIILISLLLMLTACNLGDNTTTESPTTVPTTTVVPQDNTFLETPNDSDEGNSSESPETPNDSAEENSSENGDCTVREDWPLYEITRGDTLTSVARRTDSTIEELIEANCLKNPDRLTAGDMLHVPRVPE